MRLFVRKTMDIHKARHEGMSLWTRTLKKISTGSPRSCVYKTSPHSLGTSLCAYHKASYTIEAVVVVPCMAAFLASILMFFPLLQLQVAVEEAVFYAGRKTAVQSALTDTEEVLLVTAKGHMLYALQDNEVVQRYIKGGSLGVTLIGSYCEEDKIVLRAGYKVKIPIAFWEIGAVPFYVKNTFQRWNGDRVNEEIEDEVYVTDTGSVYHISLNCQVLDLTLREVDFEKIDNERGKDGQKYYPCSQCYIKDKTVQVVYCTDYGTLYHMDLSCKSIKRNVHKIPRDEIGDRLKCSFCGNEDSDGEYDVSCMECHTDDTECM